MLKSRTKTGRTELWPCSLTSICPLRSFWTDDSLIPGYADEAQSSCCSSSSSAAASSGCFSPIFQSFVRWTEFSHWNQRSITEASSNRQRVVTSQAERPSAHAGVQEIFLSLSGSGQRAVEGCWVMLMTENRRGHPKLFWCQRNRSQTCFCSQYREQISVHVPVRLKDIWSIYITLAYFLLTFMDGGW